MARCLPISQGLTARRLCSGWRNFATAPPFFRLSFLDFNPVKGQKLLA
jgi:hypothetical protein